ncbi:MAG: TRAP transporter substrate-binding protein DctP [Alphaproteobacteria bacterium]|nr:TRAP transporter substrate-binding protein DctP [Alphaproteobacteria bacterium]
MTFGRLFAAFAVTAAIGLAAPAAEAQNFRWKMVVISNENSVYTTVFAKPFAEKVAELTNGRAQIEVVPSGVIAPPFQEYNAVIDGLADMANVPSIYIYNRDPSNGIPALPGGMPPMAALQWVYEGGGDALWKQYRRESLKMHAIVAGFGPTEIIHGHKPIRTIDDLKGVKFRTAGMWASILKDKFGGAPTVAPVGEIYTQLERKVLDAAEFSTPSENMILGLQRAAKYIMVPGAHVNSFFFETVMKQETFDKLPADIKKAMETAGKLVSFESLLKWQSLDMKAMEQLRGGGNEIVELSPELQKAIRDRTREWVYEEAKRQEEKNNPWMKRLADSYYGYLDHWEKASVFIAK